MHKTWHGRVCVLIITWLDLQVGIRTIEKYKQPLQNYPRTSEKQYPKEK